MLSTRDNPERPAATVTADRVMTPTRGGPSRFSRWTVRRRIIGWVFRAIAYVLAGRTVRFMTPLPDGPQRIYYANHSSHIDFLIVWSALPHPLRRRTRPVAGRDYWTRSRLKQYLSEEVFGAVLIERAGADAGGSRNGAGLQPVLDALDEGDSLIFFPEGTRNLGEGVAAFKSGLYHLARAHPDVELVPVRIGGAKKVLAKGQNVPIPRNSWAVFGSPLRFEEDESKDAFLSRAREAVLALPALGGD